MFILKLLALAHHPACNDGQNQPVFAVDFFLPCHERFLEWIQAEAVQLHVRAQALVTQEEAIENVELGLCAFRQACLRCQKDQVQYLWHVHYPKVLQTKPHITNVIIRIHV